MSEAKFDMMCGDIEGENIIKIEPKDSTSLNIDGEEFMILTYASGIEIMKGNDVYAYISPDKKRIVKSKGYYKASDNTQRKVENALRQLTEEHSK